MAERKKTPDILADLLGTDAPSLPIENNQNASKTVKRQTSKTLNQQSVKTANSIEPLETDNSEPTEDNPASNKVKMTFYLSEESAELLEDAQRALRRLVRNGNGADVGKAATSKSALLEGALKLACEDLEKKGDQSQLARLLF